MSYLNILEQIRSYFEPLGFECYPFKVSQYNDIVEDKFKLSYPDDTVVVLILNTPSMFEKTFLPYLYALDGTETLGDPIDECMNLHFKEMKKILNEAGQEVDTIQDYELTPTRRAKILLQTCAHISGAAYFYRVKKPGETTSSSDKKLSMGVCLHPKYGGWFAMRGVLILKNLQAPDLVAKKPEDVLQGDENRIQDLISKFNTNWRDGTYRSVIDVVEKYSDKQIEYFLLLPSERKQLIQKWLNDRLLEDVNQFL